MCLLFYVLANNDACKIGNMKLGMLYISSFWFIKLNKCLFITDLSIIRFLQGRSLKLVSVLSEFRKILSTESWTERDTIPNQVAIFCFL